MRVDLRDDFDELTKKLIRLAQEATEGKERSEAVKDAKTAMDAQTAIDELEFKIAEAAEKSDNEKAKNKLSFGSAIVVAALGAVGTIGGAIIMGLFKHHDVIYQEDAHTNRQREYVRDEKEIVMSRGLERP